MSADTNVLLRYLPLLRALINLLGDLPLTLDRPPPLLCVPHIVLTELDGLKCSKVITQPSALVPSNEPLYSSHSPQKSARSQAAIGDLSRAASNWLLSVFPSSNTPPSQPIIIRGQRKHESLIPRQDGRRAAETNDAQVLDACLYFRTNYEASARVVLLSNDRNLSLRARTEGIDSVALEETTPVSGLLFNIDPEFALKIQRLASSSSGHPPPLSNSPPRSPKPTPPVSRRPTSSSTAPRSQPKVSFISPRPIPLTPESEFMELDLDRPFPPLEAPPPPLMRTVSTATHLFLNLCDLVAHFLALPVYRHIVGHLHRTAAWKQSCWQEELGDWTLWEAKDVVGAVKRWWDDGDLKSVCLRGLELQQDTSGCLARPAPPASPLRTTSTSCWSPAASPTSTQTQSSFAAASCSPSRSQLLPAKRLQEFHLSLSSLSVTLGSTGDAAGRWSAPRYEILLEQVAILLTAILGGVYGGEVDLAIKNVIKNWALELVTVGVQVDVSLF